MTAANVMKNPAPMLTTDEQELLALFRVAPLVVKAAAINALHGEPLAPKPRATTAKVGAGFNADQAFHGTLQGGVDQTFYHTVHGDVAGGDIISQAARGTNVRSQSNHGGITIGAVHGNLSVIQIDRLKTCSFLRDLEALVQRQQEGVMV